MTSENEFPANDAIDRRQRFRVDDTAILEIVDLRDADVENNTPDKLIPGSTAFRLMREMREIDQDSSSLLRVISDKHPDIAGYLEYLNKKFSVIGNAVAESIISDESVLQTIDLSEGGLGFRHDDKLDEGEFYGLKVWFHRSLIGLAVFVKIVGCNRTIDGGHHISASFHNLSEANAQIISRHVMQVQASQQRRKKLLDEE